MDRLPCVGTWLSLVEHSLGVRGVGSSNLPVPTINLQIPNSLRTGSPLLDCRPQAPQLAPHQTAGAHSQHCEGGEALPSDAAVQICPSRPFEVLVPLEFSKSRDPASGIHLAKCDVTVTLRNAVRGCSSPCAVLFAAANRPHSKGGRFTDDKHSTVAGHDHRPHRTDGGSCRTVASYRPVSRRPVGIV